MAIRFYTTEDLGKSQSLTPEGFLLCSDVPVARTGTMTYGPGEVPVPANGDGVILIHRDEDEVFKDTFLASLAGKPCVNDHPPTDVNPANWKQYAIGVGMNPRRGTGMQADLILMDLLIQDEEAIKDVRAGKREISLGYDADYEEIRRGEGRQLDLIGNHIALVDAGRCGSRCAIGDRTSTHTGDCSMKRTKLSDTIRAAFKAKDEAGMEAALKEVKDSEGEEESGEHTHIHMHAGESATSKFTDEDHEDLRRRVEVLEAKLGKSMDSEEEKEKERKEAEDKARDKAAKDAKDEEEKEDKEDKEVKDNLEEEAPAGTADKARKARDSAYLVDSFQETLAFAEILAPGIKIPTCDTADSPKKTLDTICQLRRSALDAAYATADGKEMIESINGDKPMSLSGMKCNAVRTLFKAATAMKKAANNSAGRTTDFGTRNQAQKSMTLAELNKRNAALYAVK